MAGDPSIPDCSDEAPFVGRRGAPRLRLTIPARFVSLYSRHACILLDISRTGARIALQKPLAQGQSGYVEIDRMNVFGMIVRAECGGASAINAVAFDEPISRDAVLAVRSFAESFPLREHIVLREQARRWVAGDG